MPVEPRGLTGNTFLLIRKEIRLNSRSTTVELAVVSPAWRLGQGVRLPAKLSELRQKLGQKAKQEQPATLSNSKGPKCTRTPEETGVGEFVIASNAQLPVNAQGESFRVSPVRETRTLGLTRGDQFAMHGMRILSHDGETLKLM
jgi:hypothetical protein